MFIENNTPNMNIASSYTSDEATYTFLFDGGKKMIFPISSVILVDDESGLVSVKNIATRKTMFLVRNNGN